jgi:tetratricopeptide (TPR) repeat protein
MPGPAETSDPTRQLRELVETGRFREALQEHQATRDPAIRHRPEAELLAATAATRLGEFAAGVALAESAFQRFRSRADTDGRMRAMNLLGAIAFEQGRLEEATRAFSEVLELARQLDDTLMSAHASNNLASVAHLRGEPESSLSLYRGALLAYQRLGDRRGTAQTYHNLGLSFRQSADWLDAESAALQAVRHATQVGEGSLIALAVSGRAETHLERGELELAAHELERATALANQAGDEIGLLEISRLNAMLALASGDASSAFELAEAARRKAEALQSVQLEGECTAVAALACRQLGRESDAAVRREHALTIFGRLGAKWQAQELERRW